MVNTQTNQEVVSHANFWENNKEKSKFKKGRGREISFFLVYFFFKCRGRKENFSLFKNPP